MIVFVMQSAGPLTALQYVGVAVISTL